MRKAIISELQAAVAPPPALNIVRVWEVDAPTMERFLQDLAKEKPVRFTAQQICSFTNNYSTTLGSGGFGVVYKGQFPNGVKIAVKVLKRSLDRTAEEQFMAEIGTIGRTYHINLVRLYGFSYDSLMSALVYEYLENGSLDKYLFSDTQSIEWEKLHEIAIGTAKGIAYLHEECQQRIIHYDIKPANILLDANFLPKVGDFGLAKLCQRDNTHDSVTRYRGTPGYSAPEFMLKNFPITYRCDVYSFGMVLFEIVGNRRNAATGPTDSLDWFPKHDSPDARPPMSAVVKMLEGGVEIMPPPKPFQYLFRVGMDVLKPQTDTNSSSVYSSSEEANSYWYKKSTPVITKYEIQIATS
ncbi:hypothetical protein RJ639_038033 [Escallonia herrerae]|uniref:Protein kinase domain-containing protein n=1 Tax=Escallonia herrerae TaxID=1293975 RepID=A0AA88WL32_9ASTE|nr:hypothetical protein RJ639_038033 [Escallonia herrerae]